MNKASTIRPPLISIVVPSYNYGQYIEETILSIIDQDYSNYELIIIDGGSDDDTSKIINKYRKKIKFYISEKDNGQSHAINKGLQYCEGDLFSWINADDFLSKGALSAVADAFIENPNSIITGSTRFFDMKNIDIVKRAYNIEFKSVLHFWRRDYFWAQPSTFFPLTDDLKVDESLHMAMDYDLFLKMLKKYDVTIIKNVLSNFRVHRLAKTASNGQEYAKEVPIVIERHMLKTNSFDEKGFLRFKSRCSLLLSKTSLRKGRVNRSIRYLIKALKFSKLEFIIVSYQYTLIKLFNKKDRAYDIFKIKE